MQPWNRKVPQVSKEELFNERLHFGDDRLLLLMREFDPGESAPVEKFIGLLVTFLNLRFSVPPTRFESVSTAPA
jgi:hypothetical protein